MTNVTKKTKVIVLDDEPEMSDSIAAVLTQDGYDALAPATVQEAIVLLEKQDCDILITDIFMNNTSGYEVIDVAKRRGVKQIIAISGQSVEWESKARGADHFIRKPLGQKKLARVMLKAGF